MAKQIWLTTKNIAGLFFPVWKKPDGTYVYTIDISGVGLGWIILGIDALLHLFTG